MFSVATVMSNNSDIRNLRVPLDECSELSTFTDPKAVQRSEATNDKMPMQSAFYHTENVNNSTAATTESLNLSLILSTSTSVVDEEKDHDNQMPKTPTTSDHRIPEIRQCPPAPRKLKSMPVRKRKHSYDDKINNSDILRTSSSASRLLDFSKEIESMYPPHLRVNLGRKIKKARSM